VERCGHCGREGTLENKGDVTLSATTQTVQNGNFRDEISIQQLVGVTRCSGCGGLTLSEYRWIDGYDDPGDPPTPRILYPDQGGVADLPAEVADRYRALLDLRHEPDAFAVRAGRLLEAVCADQAISRGLSQRKQLDSLVAEADVPEELVKQAHLVYTYRNYGGHIKEFEVEAEDVRLILGFVDALLDFLYRGPANLGRVSSAFERRKAEALGEGVD
jgi:hypothetical protein